ncbi:hypothetical protein B484DRAFT_400172 [Ochromonadaceae sp. CCMP2298]|nr:hypothetical protein B484DRAFT_400172 [Ochromonadaceae sp. CCMP2298]
MKADAKKTSNTGTATAKRKKRTAAVLNAVVNGPSTASAASSSSAAPSAPPKGAVNSFATSGAPSGKDSLVVVFDIETTDLPKGDNFDNVRIVQMCCALCCRSTLEEKERVSVIIKTDGFPVLLSEIHGITEEISLRDGELFEAAATRVGALFCKASAVIAHNVQFDPLPNHHNATDDVENLIVALKMAALLLEGWLVKDGNMMGSWKNRYCTLTFQNNEFEFEYYVSDDKKDKKGVFTIARASGFKKAPNSGEIKNCFSIEVAESGGTGRKAGAKVVSSRLLLPSSPPPPLWIPDSRRKQSARDDSAAAD